MSRKEARETVFKLVYERCVNGQSNEFSFELLTQDLESDNLEYCKKAYKEIDEKLQHLSGIIEGYSSAFKIERIYKIDLAIMLVAIYEILYLEEIPDKVAANEAVELAKKYSTEKSYKFINGLISSVIKQKETLI